MSDEQEIATVYQRPGSAGGRGNDGESAGAKSADSSSTKGSGAVGRAPGGDHEAFTETRAQPLPNDTRKPGRTTGAATKESTRPGTVQSRDRTGKVKVAESGAVRPARKARLRIAKLDPWSVMKTALMFSVAAAIILFVAVVLLWSVIEASGALTWVEEILNSVLGSPDGTGTIDIGVYIDRWRVMGFTAIVCGINVVLLTALATLGAFLYNLSSSVLGGLEVTLAED